MASEHILLPYGGRPREQALLKVLCSVARRRRASLTVAFLVEVPMSLEINATEAPGVDEANRILDNAEELAARSGVQVTTAVYPCRDAGHGIVRLSQRLDCSLIVMETAGPADGTSQFDAVLEHVLASAPCEVWVSRLAEAQ